MSETRPESSAGATVVALCYGTRPQVIKASVLRRALARRWPVLAVDTGQHYDYSLNALLYEQLGVNPPDAFLEVGSGTHATQTGAILQRAEALLLERSPQAVVVIGDTNSTLGCALAAAKLRIPVVHVEAGLRAQDALMAEQVNRRVVDAIADLLCAPSEQSAARLRTERPEAFVVNTGDVAYDVLREQIGRLPAPDGRLSEGYVFATLHRAELTDRPAILRGVLEALGALALPVVLAIHPRTTAAIDAHGLGNTFGRSLRITPAVGYLESLALARGAMAVVTDSGGVQREAYWLGVPCVTVRTETEWTETVALGANRLVPPEVAPTTLRSAVEAALASRGGNRWPRDSYGDGQAARIIVEAVGTLLGRRGA